jgi:hypothetical protein
MREVFRATPQQLRERRPAGRSPRHRRRSRPAAARRRALRLGRGPGRPGPRRRSGCVHSGGMASTGAPSRSTAGPD